MLLYRTGPNSEEVAVSEEQRVVVVDVKMRFPSMVVFLVKLAIASIPAALILFLLGVLLTALFGSLLGGAGRHIL